MKRLIKISLIIGLITVVPVQLFAQETVATKEWLEATINPSLVKGKPVLKFVNPVLNIGKLSEDDKPTSYHFEFNNVSSKPVSITKISTSCGCTAAKFDKKELKPGEKGIIVLTFNPYQKAGTLDSNAFIYTNISAQYPTAKITLLGEVTPTTNQWVGYPCAMGILRLKRNKVLFNDVRRANRSTERMVCINSGEKPLKLSALLIPDYATFRTEPEVIPPGTEADIVITVDGKRLPESARAPFSFSIIVNGVNARPSDRTIQVKVTALN